MPFSDHIDEEKLAEIALALLAAGAFEEYGSTRAWKGMDWDVTDILFEKGWIENPKTKSKSVVFTEKGKILGEEFVKKYFYKK